MTICQFFLQGRCKFGQNCRSEHIYNDDRNNRNPVNSQHLNNIVKQIVDEVIATEKGGQWPLSCFSPVKGGSNIPGWEDFSPEEMRWKMYEARANGTLNQCNLEIKQLYSNAEKMRNLIKEPSVERVNLIVNALKNKKEPTVSSSQFTNSTSSPNIFGGSLQSSGTQKIFRGSASAIESHGNIFGGSTSASATGNVFGNSSQTTGNIFGTVTNFSNQNIFGGSSSSSPFSQNAFSTPQSANQGIFSNSSSLTSGNIFSNVSMSNQHIFSKAVEPSNPNVSNNFLSPHSSGIFSNQACSGPIFGSTTFIQNNENQSHSQSNIFGSTPKENIFNSNVFNISSDPNKTIFGSENQNNFTHNNHQTTKQFDSSVYSKLEDLNEEEIKSFTSPTFTFGKIPLKPPPKEYCK